MKLKSEQKGFIYIFFSILICYFLPLPSSGFVNPPIEGLRLVKEYAHKHIVLCLLPALFISGAITTCLDSSVFLKYLWRKGNKFIAYTIAAISGTFLTVCSCTVLPLFNGIYRLGAGLGTAITFLYAGPAINLLAIVLTTKILGSQMGVARSFGAILFSVIIGVCMEWLFRNDCEQVDNPIVSNTETNFMPLKKYVPFFLALGGILVFANWPQSDEKGWSVIYAYKWWITGTFVIVLSGMLRYLFNIRLWKILLWLLSIAIAVFYCSNPTIVFTFGLIGFFVLLDSKKGISERWLLSTMDIGKQMLPLLLLGVFMSGVLLGSSDSTGGLLPSSWIVKFVGDNSIWANFISSLFGAFMYFATLTEVPIVKGLMNQGMHKGPALALLLAGPALSLPNMLVIRSVIGTKKTFAYVALVVILAGLSGWIFGQCQ